MSENKESNKMHCIHHVYDVDIVTKEPRHVLDTITVTIQALDPRRFDSCDCWKLSESSEGCNVCADPSNYMNQAKGIAMMHFAQLPNGKKAPRNGFADLDIPKGVSIIGEVTFRYSKEFKGLMLREGKVKF